MDDDRLIARALAGEPDAERALYEGHVERVFRLAFRMCGDEEEARELTQRAFVRVFERLGQFRGEAALSSWIHRVACSVIVSGVERRETERRRSAPLERADAHPEASEPGDPWLPARLHAAVEALAPRRRAVFLMHDLEGYTHDEIASALGIRPGTSKAHLHQARAALRSALAAYAEDGA